jgi:hypothetical protein
MKDFIVLALLCVSLLLICFWYEIEFYFSKTGKHWREIKNHLYWGFQYNETANFWYNEDCFVNGNQLTVVYEEGGTEQRLRFSFNGLRYNAVHNGNFGLQYDLQPYLNFYINERHRKLFALKLLWLCQDIASEYHV